MDGKTVLQPIGAATFKVENMSLTVPSLTAQKTIPVRGVTTANSEVKVYDGDMLIGQTTALANGNWSIKCELYDAQNYSTHIISAQITSSAGITINTEAKNVEYDERYIEISKVTMVNVALPATSLNLCEYVTEFNFLNPVGKDLSYWYWSNYPDFTFKIEFTNNDTALISNVVLSVFTTNNQVVKIPVSYNDYKKAWIATSKFYSNSLPVNVGVSYSYNNMDITNVEIMPSYFEKTYKITNITVLNNTVDNFTANVTFNEDINVYYMYQKYPLNVKNDIDNRLKDNGYSKSFENDSCVYYNNDVNILRLLQRNNELFLVSIISEEEYPFIASLFDNNLRVARSNVFLRATKKKNALEKARDYFIQQALDEADRKKKCADEVGEILLSEAQRNLQKNMAFSFASLAGCVISTTDEITSLEVNVTDLTPDCGNGMEGLDASTRYYLGVIHGYPECDDPDPSPNHSTPTEDPSGYVYEAVPSNRLQGVTASVYYETEEENIYGECIKKTVLWDAENYEQINPQITDEFGQYSWFVPQGLWQVKYEKEGYETVYSEWLPVPPPQLDVNIAMTQVSQPEVRDVKGYESDIHIEFNKFMQPATLAPDSVGITHNGEPVSGSVEFLNIENDFVSKIRFVPETPFAVGDEVILTVKHDVQSYAGIAMAEDFVATVPIRAKIHTVKADSTIAVLLNEQEYIEVSVFPAAISSGRKITARTVSSSIAEIDKEAFLDASGKALLAVRGELPGVTVTYISVDSTDLKANVEVKVQLPVMVQSVALDKDSLVIEINKTDTLKATVLPDNASHKELVWTSSNTNVATVDASGVVRAINQGTANITAASIDGAKSASCIVTVIAGTGIETIKTAGSNIILYPNPANDFVILKNAKGKYLTVYNSSGVKILEQTINNVEENVSFASCVSGIYLFIISENGNNLGSVKLLKK
jgi:hypothetical protein